MIIEIILMVIIAFFIAFALAYSVKLFKDDPNIEKIRAELPGANCGACGFAGCNEYARAVSKDSSLIGRCVAGGKEVADKLSEIMGTAVKEEKDYVASVKCGGGVNCNDKAVYSGIQNCRASFLVGGGHKECEYGCLGFWDCINVCKFDAIHPGKDGYPVIDYEKCTGCGQCVEECPKDIIELVEKKKKIVDVECRSKDKGNIVVKKCKSGCIACGTCERNCPTKAIKVIDSIAVIDHDKCITCGICVKNCPRKIISFKIK